MLHVSASAQINSPGARTLFARNFLYRSDWRVIERSPSRRLVAWENTFVYGLPHNLMGIGVLPVVSRSLASDEPSRELRRQSGIADPMFLVHYDGLFARNRPGGFSRLAGFFGIKAPWGQEAFSTGAIDRIQGLVFTHATTGWILNADVQWTATTAAEGFEAGDTLQLDASVMYRLLRYPERHDLFLVLEINSFIEGRSRREGTVVAATGGDKVFIAPGIELFVERNLILESSVQLPLYQRLYGPQRGRDWIFVVGFRYIH